MEILGNYDDSNKCFVRFEKSIVREPEQSGARQSQLLEFTRNIMTDIQRIKNIKIHTNRKLDEVNLPKTSFRSALINCSLIELKLFLSNYNLFAYSSYFCNFAAKSIQFMVLWEK